MELRRARATCHDGEPGCDADGACDGACRFALCADAGCLTTFDVSVPLRRGGRARGKSVFRSGDTRVVLRCLPARGACAPSVTTTTTTTASTTSTTTLPVHPCSGTLSDAVTASFSCTASLSVNGLLLPVFTLRIDGHDAEGSAAALLIVRRLGSHTLGQNIILVVAKLTRPGLPNFQATAGSGGGSAELRLDSVSPAGEAHGSLDAKLPSVSGGAPLRIQAEF